MNRNVVEAMAREPDDPILRDVLGTAGYQGGIANLRSSFPAALEAVWGK